MKGFSVAVGVHDESEEVRFDLERTLITGESCGEDGRGNKLLVVPLDVKSVKSISAAAVRIQEAFPGGIDCVVNNAAQHLDGFNYQVAQEMLDVNFFGAQNVIRRMVPAVARGAHRQVVARQKWVQGHALGWLHHQRRVHVILVRRGGCRRAASDARGQVCQLLVRN